LKVSPWNTDSKDLLEQINGKLNLDKNYVRGELLFKQNNYFGAKAVFAWVNGVSRGYKNTETYMTKINSALAGQINIFYNNGVSHYNKEEYESAIAEFNKVLAINPSQRSALEYRQRAQIKMEIQKSVGGNDTD
jgi:tetratricopeptide (TPR) repeat protein